MKNNFFVIYDNILWYPNGVFPSFGNSRSNPFISKKNSFPTQEWKKNNDDARRIIQRKSNHCDDPAEVLKTERRLGVLHHRERQHRKYTKKAAQYWEEQIKMKRGKKRGISYLKEAAESHPAQAKGDGAKKVKQIKKNRKKVKGKRKK